jgi:hypothetical protein
MQKVLQEFHEGVCGGHFAPTTTSHRIMRVGYYWPSIFKYSYSMIIKCISCHKFSGKMKKATIPLQPITIEEPFAQWGLMLLDQSIPNPVKVTHISSLKLTILQNGKKL